MSSGQAKRVVVIGAGAVGSVLAYRLASAGAQVIVVERSRPAGGVSAATFAMDVTPRKTPRGYFELNRAARAEHLRLAGEVGSDWVHTAPRLEWAQGAEARAHLAEQLERLHRWGLAAELIDEERALEIEPQLARQPQAQRSWMHCPQSAWYDLPAMAKALLDRAQQMGAILCYGESVVGAHTLAGRIVECRTQSGATLAADAVAICCGPQVPEVAQALGAQLPLRRVPGLVGITEPLAKPLRSIVVSPAVGIRPDRDGRALLHSYNVDASLPALDVSPPRAQQVDRAGAAGVGERAKALLRDGLTGVEGLRGARVSELRLGVRPLPADGLPIVGWLDALANAYVAVTHSGAHLSPLLGRLAASEILGEPQPALQPYRPDRLARGSGDVFDEASRLMLGLLEPSRP